MWWGGWGLFCMQEPINRARFDSAYRYPTKSMFRGQTVRAIATSQVTKGNGARGIKKKGTHHVVGDMNLWRVKRITGARTITTKSFPSKVPGIIDSMEGSVLGIDKSWMLLMICRVYRSTILCNLSWPANNDDDFHLSTTLSSLIWSYGSKNARPYLPLYLFNIFYPYRSILSS